MVGCKIESVSLYIYIFIVCRMENKCDDQDCGLALLENRDPPAKNEVLNSLDVCVKNTNIIMVKKECGDRNHNGIGPDLGTIAKRLPDDILKKIYYDYLEIPILFSVFKTKLETEECKRIEYGGLGNLVPFILRKPALVVYMRKQYYGFDAVYRSHVMSGEKCCSMMNFKDSFACSWLMYMYH